MKPDLVCKIVRGRGRTALGTLRYIRRGCDGLFGSLRRGGITGHVSVDAGALVDRHEGYGAEVKHIVLSLREGNAGLLRELAAAWVKRFAPDRNWLAGLHENHVHLAVESEGSDGRALDFGKKDTYAMVQMGWTDLVRAAKGTVSTAVERFTEKHFAAFRAFSSFVEIQRWAEQQVTIGSLQATRRDREHRLLSVCMDGERVRLRSVLGAVNELRGRSRSRDKADVGGVEVQIAKPRVVPARGVKKAVEVSPPVSSRLWVARARNLAINIARRRKQKGKGL